MDKPANTKNTLHPLIMKRWSPRAFNSNKGIPEATFEIILEAASWAASSMNEQPWRYYYAFRKNEASFEDLLDCLMEGNQLWAQKAAILMAVSMKKNFKRNGKTNPTAQHDVGLANAQLVLEALHHDIYAHLMGGFHKDKATELLGLPDDEEVVCFIALGYKADPSELPSDDLRERERAERSRYKIDQISKRI